VSRSPNPASEARSNVPIQSAAELKEQIEAERLGDPILVYRDAEGEQRIRRIEGERGEIWIGRSEAADVALTADQQVSKLHARLDFVGRDCTLVDDGLSRNGSFINEERVNGRRRLRSGDVIRVGRTLINFRDPNDASDDEATVAADDLTSAAGVSPAQKRVLVELCRPFKDGAAFASPATNAEIAEALHLSVDAVKTHLRALFEKFGLADAPQSRKRIDLVQRAMRTGIISERDL
jgi:pSer/pThr/pTyr-binding forkhead associated (FHA) protein